MSLKMHYHAFKGILRTHRIDTFQREGTIPRNWCSRFTRKVKDSTKQACNYMKTAADLVVGLNMKTAKNK